MRTLLTITVTAALGTALPACSAPPGDTLSSPSVAYEPPAPIVRAPLVPPSGYASTQSPMTDPSSAVAPDVGSAYGGSEPPTPGHMVWQASPRWATVKGDDRIEGEQDQ
jgi:hypothetical protein